MRGMYTEHGVCRENERTNIEGSTLIGGNPVLVNGNDGLDGLKNICGIETRYAETVTGIVHTFDIFVGTEKLNTAVLATICLQTLEQLLCIVEYHCRGFERNRCVGNDTGIVPALLNGIIHKEHMIREIFTEAELAVIRLYFRRCCSFDSDI